jgi:hypothetical protein
MSAAKLQGLLDRIDQVIQAYKKPDLQGAANLRNDLYSAVNIAERDETLTTEEAGEFGERPGS